MQKRKLMLLIIIIVISVLILIFIYSFRKKIGRILSPFFMAIVIAYLVHPMVKQLEGRKISRPVSIIMVYSGVILVFTAVTIFIVPELVNSTKELINTVPDIIANYQGMFNNILSNIRSSSWSSDIKDVLLNEINSSAEMIQNYTVNTLKRTMTRLIDSVAIILDFMLALVIAYYFIKDSLFFRSQVISLIPKKWRKNVLQTGRGINLVLSSFVQGQLLTALIVSIMEIGGLLLLKVKYPLVLGSIGGIANIIPYFGPIIGAIPAVAVALVESPIKAIWTVALFVVVQQIDNAFVSPKIIEGRVGLHPVTTIMAVLAGGEFLGITGMIISVPLVAIVKAIFKRVVDEIVR